MSITNQTYTAFEVIVMDGGSTDDTAAICASFAALPLRYFSEKDHGIYDAMNKGIQKATGNYLYFMGSDDSLFDNDVLKDVATKITGNDTVYHGDVKMYGSNEWVTDGTVHGGEFDLKRLITTNISHQAIFYPTHVFATMGTYNIRYKVFADHDFNLRVYSRFKFQYLNRIIANFNVGGMSTRSTDLSFEKEKPGNLIRYFRHCLHNKSFIGLRYYVQQAAFNREVKISPLLRLYCIMIYTKLKIQSLLK